MAADVQAPALGVEHDAVVLQRVAAGGHARGVARGPAYDYLAGGAFVVGDDRQRLSRRFLYVLRQRGGGRSEELKINIY